MSSRLWVSQATVIGMIGRLGIRPYSPDPGAASVWRKVLIRLGSAPGPEARTARPAATRHDFPGPQVIEISWKFKEIKHPPRPGVVIGLRSEERRVGKEGVSTC